MSPNSALVCGCDAGIGWVCEQHQKTPAPVDPFPGCECGACQMRRSVQALEQAKQQLAAVKSS